jgi:hypothetical protein
MCQWVGMISARAGVPVHVDQWGWSCGFAPGLNPEQHQDGSSETFDLARTAFHAAWQRLLPEIAKLRRIRRVLQPSHLVVGAAEFDHAPCVDV